MYKTWNSYALIWSTTDLDKKKGKAKKGSWKHLCLDLKKQFNLSTIPKPNKYDYQCRAFGCLILTTNANNLHKSRADYFNNSPLVKVPTIKGKGKRICAFFSFTLSTKSLLYLFSPKSGFLGENVEVSLKQKGQWYRQKCRQKEEKTSQAEEATIVNG